MAGAQDDVAPLSIELSAPNAVPGDTVTVSVADEVCASGTTGVFAVNAGAPDDPDLATVTFSDPNNGTFAVPEMPEMPEVIVGAPTGVVVECVDQNEQARSGEAAFEYEPKVNYVTINKEVAAARGSPQVFGFLMVGPTDSPEEGVGSFDVLFELSDGGPKPARAVPPASSARAPTS